jgi:hypothetical protein
VRHHDAWRRTSRPLGQIEPSAQNHAFSIYLDVTPHEISPGAMIDDSAFGRKGFIATETQRTGFHKQNHDASGLAEHPSPAWLRERASGAAVAVFFATAMTRG